MDTKITPQEGEAGKPKRTRPSRRGRGEGSIFENKEKQRWEARVTLEDGRRRRHLAKTRRECQEWLNKALLAVQQGTLPTGGKQTVAQFLTRWLEDVAQPGVRDRTFVRYRELITQHVIPAIGKQQLDKLTPQHLQKLYAGARRKAKPTKAAQKQSAAPKTGATKGKPEESALLAPRTVGHIHRVLHRAFENAVRCDLLARNPCDRVDPPAVKKPEMRALTAEEAAKFLLLASADPFEGLYVLALTTGAREGELLGLKWGDLDLDAGTMQIRRTVYRLPGKGVVFGEPKSATSRRRVALMPMAVETLRQHKTRQTQIRTDAGAKWEEDDLVFPNRVGRPMVVANFYYRSFQPLLQKAELPPIRFHDLRHSTASMLLALGVHPKIVQEMLGHSSIGITMDTYSHAMPTLQDEAVQQLNQRLTTLYDATAKQIAKDLEGRQAAGENDPQSTEKPGGKAAAGGI